MKYSPQHIKNLLICYGLSIHPRLQCATGISMNFLIQISMSILILLESCMKSKMNFEKAIIAAIHMILRSNIEYQVDKNDGSHSLK